jgi:hypothetical protein
LADEPTNGHTSPAEHEALDEDSLREDQPYANLEDDLDSTSTTSPSDSDSGGGGSW